MKKNKQQIIEEIRILLNELEGVGDSATSGVVASKKKAQAKPDNYSGCSGGLRHLVEQGYFDQPRNKQEIVVKLKEIGRYYSSPLVSMNLLNLSGNTERLLTKLGQRGSYKFVIRK